MTSEFDHTPVLLPEIIDALQPRPGGRYVDATLGGGGHAEKILESTSSSGALLGIDADPAAVEAASRRLAPFGERVVVVQAYFDQLAEVAAEHDFTRVDGILFDLGVSSPQLDMAERGFSFQHEAPLDMRLGPGAGPTAADLLNTLSRDELQHIFAEYGEERYARRMAQRIVSERARRAIRTTTELAEVVTRARPPQAGRERIHPATRVFQALRIAVNDELGRLTRVLPQTLDILQAGGRLAVISFHSLEDRIVKQFMRQEAKGCICPPEYPTCVCGRQPTLRILTRKPISPSPGEVAANPRARSAKLRVAERLTDLEQKFLTSNRGGAS